MKDYTLKKLLKYDTQYILNQKIMTIKSKTLQWLGYIDRAANKTTVKKLHERSGIPKEKNKANKKMEGGRSIRFH